MKITLTEKQAHNLYDLQYMFDKKLWDIIELNNMSIDVQEFFLQLEKHCVPEIYNKKLHDSLKSILK